MDDLSEENPNDSKKLIDDIDLFFSYKKIKKAAFHWTFVENGMKWSNNDGTAGDNYGSFMAGAKWVLSHIKNLMEMK